MVDHTPGPWKILKPLQVGTLAPFGEDGDSVGDPLGIIGLMVGPDKSVCLVLLEDPYQDYKLDPMWADASLISAAPDLLEAAERALVVIESLGGAQQPSDFVIVDKLRTAIAKANGEEIANG